MKRQLIAMLSVAVLLACPGLGRSQSRDPSENAHQVLDRLDTRKPVPLLPMMADHQKQNMRDHLVAVQEIVAAFAADDFPTIGSAARRIGSSAQMNQMCTHMGAGASGFTDQALAFHRSADAIAEAAARRDRNEVVRTLATTLLACTGCHTVWKQQVVDEATWSRLTGGQSAGEGHGPAH
jgi:hypothetical protein